MFCAAREVSFIVLHRTLPLLLCLFCFTQDVMAEVGALPPLWKWSTVHPLPLANPSFELPTGASVSDLVQASDAANNVAGAAAAGATTDAAAAGALIGSAVGVKPQDSWEEMQAGLGDASSSGGGGFGVGIAGGSILDIAFDLSTGGSSERPSVPLLPTQGGSAPVSENFLLQVPS